MIDNAFGLILVQHGAGMDSNVHEGLGCLVDVLSLVPGAVGKKGTRDTFSNVGVEVVLVDGQLFVIDVDFDTFHQIGQLVFDISGPT